MLLKSLYNTSSIIIIIKSEEKVNICVYLFADAAVAAAAAITPRTAVTAATATAATANANTDADTGTTAGTGTASAAVAAAACPITPTTALVVAGVIAADTPLGVDGAGEAFEAVEVDEADEKAEDDEDDTETLVDANSVRGGSGSGDDDDDDDGDDYDSFAGDGDDGDSCYADAHTFDGAEYVRYSDAAPAVLKESEDFPDQLKAVLEYTPEECEEALPRVREQLRRGEGGDGEHEGEQEHSPGLLSFLAKVIEERAAVATTAVVREKDGAVEPMPRRASPSLPKLGRADTRTFDLKEFARRWDGAPVALKELLYFSDQLKAVLEHTPEECAGALPRIRAQLPLLQEGEDESGAKGLCGVEREVDYRLLLFLADIMEQRAAGKAA